jgi:hypothetical protein
MLKQIKVSKRHNLALITTFSLGFVTILTTIARFITIAVYTDPAGFTSICLSQLLY